MRFCSSRRKARLAVLALGASAAPIALLPSIAQEFTGFRLLGPGTEAASPDVARSHPPEFDASLTPLELHPDRLGAFDTANMLPENALRLYLGTMQTDPGTGAGTGNQVYFGGGRWSPVDGVTVGVDFWTYEDPVLTQINGANPDIVMEPLAFSGKVRVFDNGMFKAAAQASLETFYRLQSPLYGGTADGELIGSLKLPVTYQASPRLQFHVTPAVSVFPETVNGMPFYGTVASLGAGVSYRASERLAFYGSYDMPFGPGGNTITTTGTYENVGVWTVGGRYNLTPRVALDAFLTNGVGMTPATSILTHFPSGDTVLAGVKLSYTPGAGYRQTYRGRPETLSNRQLSLQQDGFTLGSPDVLEPGDVSAAAWYGTGESYGVALSHGVDRDFGVDVIFEDYSDTGTANPMLVPTTEPRYMIGPKLRFMDQNNGDAISLSARLLFGRQLDPGVPGVGAKTAATLVGRFDTWAELRAAVDDRSDTRLAAPVRAKLAAAEPYLSVVEPVVRVAVDADVHLDRDDALPAEPADPDRLDELAARWGLDGSVQRLRTAMAR